MLFNSLHDFYKDYEMPLGRAFHEIDKRGIYVDQDRLTKFKTHLRTEIESACGRIESTLGMRVVAKQPKGVRTPVGTLNLSSPAQLKVVITNTLGIKLKVVFNPSTKKSAESTGEEALNEAYAKTNNPVLKEILKVRELNKIDGTYAEANLLDSVLYTSYSVAGTVSGRRASRTTIFTSSNGRPIGTNAQNLPKQSELGKRFRECLVARPGKIFLSCDQAQAEDWIVSAIIADVSQNTRGIDELSRGVDRHKRLAVQIFQKPESECGKGTMFRFMGKKTRHAGNYGMTPPRMAVELAKEGFSITQSYCELMLGRFHEYEPEIRNSFQKYVEDCLRIGRVLRTPVGRERYFFGLRPSYDNSKIFKEAFSYIPQSTVGDNTGLAILHCEREEPGLVLMDGHDAITLELDDNEEAILKGVELLREAFNRKFTFPLRGVEIQIPIDFELGYDMKNEMELDTKCADYRIGLRSTLNTLRQQANRL